MGRRFRQAWGVVRGVLHQAWGVVRYVLTYNRTLRSAGATVALCVICLLPLTCTSNTAGQGHDAPAPEAESTHAGQGGKKLDLKAQSTHVIIHSTGHKRWVAWPAPDAVKFSLDQLVTTIRYLFAAAAVGLAFIGKIVIEPRLSATSVPLPRPVQYALIAAALFWIGSITAGWLAHADLNLLGTSAEFPMAGPLSSHLLFQIAYFVLALWLLVVALVNSI